MTRETIIPRLETPPALRDQLVPSSNCAYKRRGRRGRLIVVLVLPKDDEPTKSYPLSSLLREETLLLR